MTVIVLGHLVLDEIHTHDGKVIESLGGIYFPLSAFGALAQIIDRILPFFPVGFDAERQLHEALRIFPQIDVSGLNSVSSENTRVRLFHDSPGSYNTQLVRSLQPIPFESFSTTLPNADLIYINMMTGDDVTVETMERVRRSTDALIYLDLHMIAYRVRNDGHRHHAPVEQWERIVAAVDILQCNEQEFRMIGGDVENDERAGEIFTASNLRSIIVTMGAAGARVYERNGQCELIPARHIPHVVDSTGCGDVFGTTAAYGIASGLTIVDACSRAAEAAAFVATIPGSIGIEGIRSVFPEVA